MLRFIIVTLLTLSVSTFSLSQESPAPSSAKTTHEEVKAPAPATEEASNHFDSTTCKLKNLVRKVFLTYGDTETKANCEVHYIKETEAPGEDKVLWSAISDSGFCTEKKASFVEKFRLFMRYSTH